MFTLLLCILAIATTDSSQPPVYSCKATAQAVTVDGKLDDPAWASAAWTSDFVDIRGQDAPAPPFRTRAKLLWDQNNLYIAAELEESNVRATMRRRDNPLFRENAFELFLDPDSDGKNYLELEINALNTIFDLLMDKPYKEGGHANGAWTIEGMQTAVHVDGTLNDPSDRDKDWTIEIAIPWSAIKKLAKDPLPPKVGTRWRMEMARSMWRVGERGVQFVAWSPTGEVNTHMPEKWGVIEFEKSK